MIKLEEWEEEIVKDLENLMRDKSVLTSKFDAEQLVRIKKTAFLIKHLQVSTAWVIFEYGGKKIKLTDIDELPIWDIKSTVFSEIMSQPEFDFAWKQFYRDWKLEQLI